MREGQDSLTFLQCPNFLRPYGTEASGPARDHHCSVLADVGNRAEANPEHTASVLGSRPLTTPTSLASFTTGAGK